MRAATPASRARATPAAALVAPSGQWAAAVVCMPRAMACGATVLRLCNGRTDFDHLLARCATRSHRGAPCARARRLQGCGRRHDGDASHHQVAISQSRECAARTHPAPPLRFGMRVRLRAVAPRVGTRGSRRGMIRFGGALTGSCARVRPPHRCPERERRQSPKVQLCGVLRLRVQQPRAARVVRMIWPHGVRACIADAWIYRHALCPWPLAKGSGEPRGPTGTSNVV